MKKIPKVGFKGPKRWIKVADDIIDALNNLYIKAGNGISVSSGDTGWIVSTLSKETGDAPPSTVPSASGGLGGGGGGTNGIIAGTGIQVTQDSSTPANWVITNTNNYAGDQQEPWYQYNGQYAGFQPLNVVTQNPLTGQYTMAVMYVWGTPPTIPT
jgi:hypothetical protein